MTGSIKILISCNAPCILPSSPNFLAVEGGRALRRPDHPHASWLDSHTVGDDTGENISRKNRRYNELTVIYWAWKNYSKIENPDYIGLMHYRRWFIIDDWSQPSDGSWTYNIRALQSDIEKFTNIYGFSKLPDGVDIFHTFYKHNDSVINQYLASKNHSKKSIDECLKIISGKYPEYIDVANEYFLGMDNIFCNMFIMKRKIFFEYCEWLFSILGEYDKNRNYKNLSLDEMRFYISERLTGIFIKNKLKNGVSCKPLAIALLEDTDLPIKPAFDKNNIPVVFAVDEQFLPFFSVAFFSLLNNISSAYNYDIFILHNGLAVSMSTSFFKRIIEKKRCNVSIRLIDVRKFLTEEITDTLYFSPIVPHITIPTYFRLFLEKIFYNFNKVVYLDSDILIQDDISKLYKIDLEGKWLGAVKDFRESIRIRHNTKEAGIDVYFGDYLVNDLGLKNVDNYFQAGVLVFNIPELIKNHIFDKIVQTLRKVPKPVLQDQDILNAVFQGHVKFLPDRWNVEWQITFEFADLVKELPLSDYARYMKSRHNPAIIHYASPIKPWNSPDYDLADLWWRQARQTPFYEHLQARLAIRIHEEDSTIHISLARKIAQKILPQPIKKLLKVMGIY